MLNTTLRLWPAWLVLAFIGLITGTALTGLLSTGGIDLSVLTSRRVWRVIRFSFIEAGLSTVLSLAFGICLALALHRRLFKGRSALLGLMGASFVLPPIVVVAGVIAVFGRNGWLSNASEAIFGLGFNQWLYGLPGILIAHVFFNAAFSARVFLGQLDSVPAHQWRQAHQLEFSPWSCWRVLDWPVLRALIPNLAVLIFLLTFTSFAIVLTLGGGPKASTLEVAIFEALKFDFDIGKAVTLALVQALIGLVLLSFASATKFPWPAFAPPARSVLRPDTQATGPKMLDGVTLGIAIVLIVLPVFALFIDGLSQLVQGHGLDRPLLSATLTSLGVAVAAATLAISLAICMALTNREASAQLRLGHSSAAQLIETITSQGAALILVLPVFVLSTGLFVVLRHYMAPDHLALPLMILVNALMALPFAAAQLSPALAASANRTDRTCLALGLSGFKRFHRIDLPLIRPALARASAYALALSLGDLGIVALFGSQNIQTLPFLLYQRLGSYRFGEGMATALVLVLLVIFIFVATERLGRRRNA